jgi:hypothetical protein
MTPTEVRGSLVGAAIGLVPAVVGLAFGQPPLTVLGLLLCVPPGAAAGAVAGRWIRAARPIPLRAILIAALVADLVGAFVVAGAGSVIAALSPFPPETNVLVMTVLWTLVGLVSVGWMAYIPLAIAAWIGAMLLRRWETQVHGRRLTAG